MINQKSNETNITVGRDQLFDILRKKELLVSRKKKYVKTTNSYHRFRVYKNLIKKLKIIKPNQVFVSDITYINLLEGFSYLSLITDLYSRKIVGYYLSKSLGIEGCLTSLRMALKTVKQPKNLIHHSDRGIQYCSHAYVELLQKKRVKISMTEENHVYENAVAERVNGTLKSEFMLDETLTSFEIAKQLVKEAVEIYNNKRPHLTLNYNTPDDVYTGRKKVTHEKNKYKKNFKVINTESTSYQQESGTYQHISGCLKALKLNNI